MTASSATSEYTWVREPSESPIVVRDPLEETGKPCMVAEATLAAPSARSSWFASTE
jgi:hypothetical protein